MAITLTDIAESHDDKLAQGFINEIITDNYLLGALMFDDCISANGGSTLTYAYDRVQTPATANVRSLNGTVTASVPKVKRYTTDLAIINQVWDMDRVSQKAAPDQYELHITESRLATIRKFNDLLINGDKAVQGFDGVLTAVKGSNTEHTSLVDLTTVTQAAALAFADELDMMFAGMTRDPDVLLVNPKMKVKINAMGRILGLATTETDDMGRRVTKWNGVTIQEMRDGCMATNDVIALCLGMNEFHGVTLEGGNGFNVYLPDWNQPGAVKQGETEVVIGCALKATKAAAVLHPKAGTSY